MTVSGMMCVTTVPVVSFCQLFQNPSNIFAKLYTRHKLRYYHKVTMAIYTKFKCVCDLNPCHAEYKNIPCPFPIFYQSDYLMMLHETYDLVLKYIYFLISN